MASDLTAWVNGSAANNGWVLVGGEGSGSTAMRFNSTQNGTDPPRLTIDFDGPVTTGACCARPTAASSTTR